MAETVFVLGGGVTGLAAGMASGLPVLEAEEGPGGLCSSYYMRPGTSRRLSMAPVADDAYRFELGGGHWIFGGDPLVLRLLRRLRPMATYTRRAAVYFPEQDRYVPYPLQGHLRALDPGLAAAALAEMARPGGSAGTAETMKGWLVRSFGPTLCQLFFHPFHERYTAGLYDRIAPQDAYKSATDLTLAIQGAFGDVPPAGYNPTFAYPEGGLDTLTREMARRCDLRTGQRVTRVDLVGRELSFADGSRRRFDALISTLPLNRMAAMAGLTLAAPADPHTSVLVLNIGAARGPRCPEAHWIYCPITHAGFHRVGVYSNVDPAFLPGTARARRRLVSLYVERAYPANVRPGPEEIAAYAEAVLAELRAWGYIGEPEVVDPTWIDVAYTWAWPGSGWRPEALRALEAHDVHQTGRYGRWVFQGIADSVRDGLIAGASVGLARRRTGPRWRRIDRHSAVDGRRDATGASVRRAPRSRALG
ncbi:MAG TPA: FAD-dependent oxidoreductase [Methylomirabilota bacterium]|jgi:protoporphyrinogen oxidase|nr:FAD-dependent oxidoreductase [Methylomirabilota bacterium]